jgi:hypothetical protein
MMYCFFAPSSVDSASAAGMALTELMNTGSSSKGTEKTLVEGSSDWSSVAEVEGRTGEEVAKV